jgi:hypothetical protein
LECSTSAVVRELVAEALTARAKKAGRSSWCPVFGGARFERFNSQKQPNFGPPVAAFAIQRLIE